MSSSSEADLAEEAQVIVGRIVAAMISENEDDDLSWLPEDFGRRVMAIAWARQFDIDKAMFRRELNRYLDAVVEGVA